MKKSKMIIYISMILAVGVLVAIPLSMNIFSGRNEEQKTIRCKAIDAEEEYPDYAANVKKTLQAIADASANACSIDANEEYPTCKTQIENDELNLIRVYSQSLSSLNYFKTQDIMINQLPSAAFGMLTKTAQTNLLNIVKDKKHLSLDKILPPADKCGDNKIVMKFAPPDPAAVFKDSDTGLNMGIDWHLRYNDKENLFRSATATVNYEFKTVPVSITWSQPLMKDSKYNAEITFNIYHRWRWNNMNGVMLGSVKKSMADGVTTTVVSVGADF